MKTCLIVDDSRVIRKVSRHILETLGFSVEEAENGKLGLDKCLVSMPDVILLDWNMPVMTGIQFISKLRRSEGGDKPKWCSAPPRTTWPTFARRSAPVPTNMS